MEGWRNAHIPCRAEDEAPTSSLVHQAQHRVSRVLQEESNVLARVDDNPGHLYIPPEVSEDNDEPSAPPQLLVNPTYAQRTNTRGAQGRMFKGEKLNLVQLITPRRDFQTVPQVPVLEKRETFFDWIWGRKRIIRTFPMAVAKLRGALKSYLNWLPEEVMANVVRHVSSRPRHSKWQGRINPSDAYSLLRSGTPLAGVTRRLLPVLSTCMNFGDEINLNFNHSKNKNGNFVVPNPCDKLQDERILAVGSKHKGWVSLLEGIISEIGPFLTEIYIHFHITNMAPVWDYRKYLTNLKVLHTVESTTFFGDRCDLSVLLQSCAGQLRALDIKGDFLKSKHILAIAKYCVGVQDLRIVYKTWQQDLSPVWMSLGPTLDRLCLSWPQHVEGLGSMDESVEQGPFPEWRAKLCDDVAEHCRRLRILDLGVTFRRTAAVVRVVRKFGSQLQVLRMVTDYSCLPPQAVRQVLEACPNIVVDAFVQYDEPETLFALGGRVRSARFAVVNQLGLDAAGRAVKNVEELHLYADGRDHEANLRKFLVTPKPLLRSVSMIFGLDDIVMHQNAIDVVSELVSSLEEFSCTFGLDIRTDSLATGIFRKLARANRRLERVKLSFDLEVHCKKGESFRHKRLSMAEDATVSFVEDFSECPRIRELVIETDALRWMSERVAKSAHVYRGRNADIFVGGIQYFV